jgi:protein SCO1/2
MKYFVRAKKSMLGVPLILALVTGGLQAATNPYVPPNLNGIGIDQKLNAQIPLDTVFRDENGASIPLRAFFGKKPVVLAPVYYRCPMLCSQILSGVVAGLRPLSLKPGRDFEVVAISFDPADTPSEAKLKRDHYSHSYSSRAGPNGWHFLVGNQAAISGVMQSIGFHYRWDPVNKMFVHASGVMVITPEGRVARYLYGVEYEPKDLKLSLVEASHDRIGSAVDRILLYCYHYDPKTGKYGAVVLNTLKAGAILILALMAIGMFFFWRSDLRKHRQALKEVTRL